MFNLNFKGFTLLRSKYANILVALPEDYQQTLHKLQDILTDDQMCNVLSCSNSSAANRMIFDYLINNLKYKEDMLDLCDQLDRLTNSPSLLHIISELRNGMPASILCLQLS